MAKESKKDTDTMPVRSRSDAGRRRRWLTRVYPPGPLFRVALGPEKVVLGRDSGSPPLDDPQMSRRHAEIIYAEELDLHRVRDLGSKNGTHVGGRRIDTEYLRAGAVLRIGGSLFAYSSLALPKTLESLELFDTAQSPVRAFAEHMIELAAPAMSPVLIRGPTGSGKELLAARLHEKSGRKGAFVAVNCATLNTELIASELFGHKRGAFSGAHEDRDGLFLAADGGTLFLDEIAELPLEQQPALLRALQERKIRPVGADKEIAADVRIVAATHRDLDELSERGKFRTDLLARVAGVRIELAGLDRRREDILPLLASFLATTPDALDLSVDAAEALLIHDWPMNVRELEHAATNVKLLWSSGEELDLSLLPVEVQRGFQQRSSTGDAEPKQHAPGKDELERLLAKHLGNVAAVAQELGRHRQQVYRWLSAHGIDPAQFRG